MKFQLNPNFFSFAAPANKKSSAPQQQGRKVLSSTIADSWYPGEKEPLRNMIQNYLTMAEVETNNTPVGNDCNIFIVPHAGYQYMHTVI